MPPIIPDYRPSQGNWNQAAPDPRVATLPGEALSSIGRALIGTAADVSEIGLQIKAVKDRDALNKARLAFAQATAQHQEFRMQTPDESKWVGHLEKTIGAARQSLGALDVSPGARHEIDQEWNSWKAQAATDTHVDAVKFGITRARQNETNLVEGYLRAGKFGDARAIIQGSLTLTPEDKAARELDVQTVETRHTEKQAEEAALNDIALQPAEWLAKPHPELSPRQKQIYDAHARTTLKALTSEAIDAFNDVVATGAVSKPEEIDTLFGATVRPSVLAEMKHTLATRQSELEQAYLQRPEVQTENIGAAMAAIQGYNPEAPENFDSDMARINGMLADVPKGPARDELERVFKAKREGTLDRRKTMLERALDSVTDVYTKGHLGGTGGSGGTGEARREPGEVRTDTTAKIADGYLRDGTKLATLGFSKEQLAARDSLVADALAAEEAKQAKAVKEGAPPMGEETKKLAALAIENTVSKEWLQSNWVRRSEPVTADAETLAIGEAIHAGAASAKFIDEHAAAEETLKEREAKQRLGTVARKLADWAAANPKATEPEYEAKAFEWAGEEVRKQFRASKITPAPRNAGFDSRGRGSLKASLTGPLAAFAGTFEESGRIYGVDPRLLAAISMNETGNGTSSAFRNKNNAMGISDASGPIHIDSVETSIKRMARLLGSTSGGPYRNARTLAEIAAIYAPPGAVNDPRGLNGGWLEAVSRNYRALGGDPSAPIK